MRIFKKIVLVILLIIITIGMLLAAIVGFVALSELLMAPEDYLFYEYGQISGTIMIILLMAPVVLLFCNIGLKMKIISRKKIEETEELMFFWYRLGKGKIAVIVVFAIALYCCFTNVTYVTENNIIVHTPINPMGREYEYADVEQIETGFGDKLIWICEYKEKGNFYYTITLEDKKIVFHSPSTNGDIKRYEENTYLELEEFDKALEELKIPKKASSKGYEDCDFDKEYVDRFLRIIGSG